MTTSIVYLNGKFLSSKKAKISVFDRGFLFGDGVYEVIPVYAGKPFRLMEHLLRLKSSLEAIHFSVSIDLTKLEQALLKLLQQNRAVKKDYSIYVQITRGTTYSRSFYFTADLKPTIFASLQMINSPSYEELSLGKTAITLEDIRWQHNHIKSTSLLPSVLLYDQVRRAGCNEGILLRGGYVIEGISSNVFIVYKKRVITPPLSKENLSGVTRELVLRLLKQGNIPFVTKRISAKMLFMADEVWVTSSTRGIFPIIRLDKKTIGNSRPGAIWQVVANLYFEYRKQL